VIVPLGRHALAHFAPDLKISEAHGRAIEREGRTLFPMYHPAAAMHNQSLRAVLEADAAALGEALRYPTGVPTLEA
jgi:uracil-DNA glycosylase